MPQTMCLLTSYLAMQLWTCQVLSEHDIGQHTGL